MSSFKFVPDKCPECAAGIEHVLERVSVKAYLVDGEPGTFDYAGDSDVDWNTQEMVSESPKANGSAATVFPGCNQGHSWAAQLFLVH